MLERTGQTYGHNRYSQLLRDPETAFIEFIDMAVATAFRVRKNDEAGAAIDGVLREPPHALEIGRAPHVGDRNVSEALHQPSVGRYFEMGLKFPAADVLRDGAVQNEGVKEIDMIRHEKTRAAGIETRGSDHLDARAGKKCDAAAEAALEPIVLVRVQEDSQKDEQRRNNEEVQAAKNPKTRAAQRQQCALHI